MRVFSGATKSIGGFFIVWLTYINDTFSPLFWVLLALVFVDLVLNIHKEGKQFEKLGSAAVAMGIPSFIGENIGNPHFIKYLVAMMCLVYVQHVVPQLVALISKLKVSKDPATNEVTQELLEDLVRQEVAKIQQQAQDVLDSAKQAGIQSGDAAGKESGDAK
jgi:hypothetical protein